MRKSLSTIESLLVHKMYRAALQSSEQAIFLSAYEHAKKNQVQTAKLLGVSRGTLISRLKIWRII